MSSAADPRTLVPPEWDELELSVRRLLDEFDGWRRRAARAEARVQELEAALSDVSSGAMDPLELRRRVQALEAENAALTDRLRRAHGNVSRILDRLEFAGEAS